MVKAFLKKVFIKNFKSLHDCEIDIGMLNVIVGANASGKSNLLEAFRLLKKIYVDKDINPFTEWWGYNNVVWQRKEELSITIGMLFDIEVYDVYFETTFTGVGGKFQILREVLDVRGYLKFEKDGEWIVVNHDADYINNIIKNINNYKSVFGGIYGAKAKLKKEKTQLIKERKIRVDIENSLLTLFINISWGGRMLVEEKTSKMHVINQIIAPRRFGKDEKTESITTLCPVIYEKEEIYDLGNIGSPLYSYASETILSILSKQLILYPLNIRSMKIPQPFRREETIKEDGINIASVYHTIYLEEGKVPEEIQNPLSLVFPKIDVRPHITDDGRVMIKFFEEGFELLPPNTSDGIYKIL